MLYEQLGYVKKLELEEVVLVQLEGVVVYILLWELLQGG
jgi:hypothetical protein